MGKFMIAAASDIGRTRTENQDSYLVRTAILPGHSLCMGVLCDGMGGLAGGKEAGQQTVTAMNDWFLGLLPRLFSGELDMRLIDDEAIAALREASEELGRKAEAQGLRMGTTATVLLIIDNKYRIYHVGDSRAYHYSNTDIFSGQKLRQLTDDDSLAAQKVRMGEMTPEEALSSPDGNVLIQCIGASKVIDVHKYAGELSSGDCFFLCSDGMYRRTDCDELTDLLDSCKEMDGQAATSAIQAMMTNAMNRGESDNLTGLAVVVN